MNMYQGTTTAAYALAAAMEHIPPEIREALLRLDRVSTLPRRCLVAVAEAARIVDYKAGATIVGRDIQPVVLFLLQGRLLVKHSNGTAMRYDAIDEPIARPLYRAGEEVEVVAVRSARLLEIPHAVYVRQLSLAASEPDEPEAVEEAPEGDEHDGLERALRSGVLSRLTSEKVRELLLTFEEKHVEAGALVYSQGDVADGFFIVQHGAVEAYRAEAGGNRQRIAVLGPGDSFGEEALLLESPRPESVSMLTAGTLLRIPRADFATLLQPTLVRTLVPTAASSLVNAGGCWLDVRESSTQAIELARFAVKMPLSTLREKRGTLSAERAYIVYADDPRREALACFLLAEIGLSAFTLDGQVEQLEGEAGGSTDDLLGDDFGELQLPELDPPPSGPATPACGASGGGLDDHSFPGPAPGDEAEAGPAPADLHQQTLILEPLGVDFELSLADPPAAASALPPEVGSLLAAERARFERRLVQKVADLRLVARRKAKDVLNRRTAEMRARVLARMQELRAERRALEARRRATQAEQQALAAERQALAEERAALAAERSALELERAKLARKRAARKRLAARGARAGGAAGSGDRSDAGD